MNMKDISKKLAEIGVSEKSAQIYTFLLTHYYKLTITQIAFVTIVTRINLEIFCFFRLWIFTFPFRQIVQSKDFQLRANIGVQSVANNSLNMGIDKKRNVSKNIFSKNNLPIQMERNEVNDQLVAHRKANEILSHQLRELREYVFTIVSSLPSKTAQNLNDISIVAKSMIDERDKKMGEKEIDRMLKVMPYFNGDSGDNFESWVLSARKIISYGKKLHGGTKAGCSFDKG
jgi:hypothetical protein